MQEHRGSELTRRAALQTPMEAVRSATSVNAAILRRPELGRVVAGAVADVIVIAGDPLDDPVLFDAPHRIRLVVKDGRVVKNTL